MKGHVRLTKSHEAVLSVGALTSLELLLLFYSSNRLWLSFSFSLLCSCFLAWKGPLKFILLPFQGLMFTFNAVCYILVALRLVCSKEMGSTKSAWQIASRRVRNAVAIASLLGMSWAFGFISLVYVDDTGKTTTTHGAPNIFDVLFCATLSMKGIIVFVLFCLRREEFWEPWRKVTDLVSRTGRVKDGQCQQYISNEGTTTNLHKSSLPSSGDSTATVWRNIEHRRLTR